MGDSLRNFTHERCLAEPRLDPRRRSDRSGEMGGVKAEALPQSKSVRRSIRFGVKTMIPLNYKHAQYSCFRQASKYKGAQKSRFLPSVFQLYSKLER